MASEVTITIQGITQMKLIRIARLITSILRIHMVSMHLRPVTIVMMLNLSMSHLKLVT